LENLLALAPSAGVLFELGEMHLETRDGLVAVPVDPGTVEQLVI